MAVARDALLAVHGVSRAFGSRVAVRDVSFEVCAGELVLLAGRNGAGKTTLLRLVTGFLDPDDGEILVGRWPMATDRACAQALIGYLPEHTAAPAELTVIEHLTARARLKGLVRRRPGRHTTDTITQSMELAALGEVRDRRIGSLSKGFRQRVGLADALLGDPPLLVLDEPTSGLDPVQVRELRAVLVAAAANRAVVVSSHDLAGLVAVATRVVVLAAGAVTMDSVGHQLNAVEDIVAKLDAP